MTLLPHVAATAVSCRHVPRIMAAKAAQIRQRGVTNCPPKAGVRGSNPLGCASFPPFLTSAVRFCCSISCSYAVLLPARASPPPCQPAKGPRNG